MTNENKKHSEEQDPELDVLLDDALDDFNKPTPPAAINNPSAPPQSGAGASGVGQQVLTEEMIKQATQNFEDSMRAIMMQQQYSQQQASVPAPGGAVPAALPADAAHFDVNTLTAQFAKFAESASKVAGAAGGEAAAASAAESAAAGGKAAASDFQNILAETVKQMAENTQEFQAAPSTDELSQLLSGLGLAGGVGEADGLFPLMQSMLENILSKDILYPPIKEIVDKYPDWLADHRTSVEPADFDRYSRQYDIMKKVVELFESENESDSDEVKAKRFEDLMMHMQKLQEEGHPPAELGGDVAGNLASLGLDASGGATPDFGALLAGLPTGPTGPPSQGGEGEEQCCLM